MELTMLTTMVEICLGSLCIFITALCVLYSAIFVGKFYSIYSVPKDD